MLIFLMIVRVGLLNIDEHYYNKNRSHTKYEILSVITDGIFLMIPLLFATFVPHHPKWELTYKVMGASSMLSIVKNELFYNKDLQIPERLIHAALYVLHPILLFSFYESWTKNYFDSHPNFWMIQIIYVGIGFKTVSYQLVYWNYIHEKK